MRTGLVIYGSLETLSGGYLYDRKLVEYLRRCGDQVEIISLPWQNYAAHLRHNLNREIIHRLANLEVDYLLQDELNHPSLFWINRQINKRKDYPIISIVHHLRSSETHPTPLAFLYRQIERWYLKSVDGFIFNSQTTRKVVEGIIHPPIPGVVALPGCDRLGPEMDGEQVRSRATRSGPLKIVFLGNLIPRKGLHTLIDALTRLKTVDWRLEILGSLTSDPRYAKKMQLLARRANITDRIQFLGSLPDQALINKLEPAHLLVVPSTYEGYGIVYIEAMGFGLPAIATLAGAASEIITHGENGYLIPPGDAKELANHILSLAQDRRRLARMSGAALERYAAHSTWEMTGQKIRGFLKSQSK